MDISIYSTPHPSILLYTTMFDFMKLILSTFRYYSGPHGVGGGPHEVGGSPGVGGGRGPPGARAGPPGVGGGSPGGQRVQPPSSPWERGPQTPDLRHAHSFDQQVYNYVL